MHAYIKQVQTIGLDKETKILFSAKVERPTREEIDEARLDDSLDILFEGMKKEQECIDTIERLFDCINECYQNDIDYDVHEWLKEFLEEEEKNVP